MKNFFTLLFAVAFFASGNTQTITDHPLKKINRPVQAMEFVVFHTDNSNSSNSPTKVTLGHYVRDSGLSANQRIVQDHSYTNTTANNTTGSKSLNVITLDMNGDSYDEIVTAREKGNQVILSMPQVQRNPLTTLADGPGEAIDLGTIPSGAAPQIKMAKGDFRRNGKEYFAVATPNYSAKKISIDVFFYDSLAGYPSFCGHINADSLYFDGSNRPVGNFDITINDFNGDSIPDIALAALEKESGGFSCYVKTFKVTPAPTDAYLNWTITEMGKQTVGSVGSNATLQNLAISSGVYDSTAAPQKQIAVAVAYVDRNDNTLLHRKLYIASTGSGTNGLNTVTVAANNYVSDQSNFNDFPAVAIATGDLNSDASEEIVLAFDNAIRVYSVGSGLAITPKGSGSGGGITNGFSQLAPNNAYIDIGDVDLDLENDFFMVTSHDDQNSLQYLTVTVFGANPSLAAVTVKGSKSDLQQASFSGFGSNYRFAAAFGEFNGGRGILKAPVYSIRKILTPIVVNNSPPYHYDILGTDTADLTSCFPGSGFQCNQNSQYKAVTTQSSTVEANLKSDWGVSGTLSAGGSVMGVGLKASVTAKYGEAFSQTQTNTDTKTVSTLSTATADDQIYGVVSDFDVYEYPIDSSGVTIGYILAMMRAATPIYQFMDSKSADAYTYVPDHEVGNLLSYAPNNDFTNYAGNLATIHTATGSNIGSGGTLNFTMTHTNFSQSSVADTKTFGVEVNAGASYFGVGLDVTGTYNSSEMTTHTSTASSEVSYTSNLIENLNPAYADANYTLTPYVYWSKNGSISLGYAVDPSLPQTGTNFWKDHYYTKPDLTVIMPWKYDPEKGYSLGNTPDKRRLCKSIFPNKSSYITGDTVNITTFIHNYSFLDYNGPVQFQFYAGNPDNGGILLSDINGQSTLTVNTLFKARGRTPVQFDWKVAPGIPTGSSIYIVIDPTDQIDEVHEENNVGFYQGAANVNSIGNVNAELSYEAKLFPNPVAGGQTQVELKLPVNGQLKAELTDLQGRTLKTLYNSNLWSGNFLLPVEVSELPRGFYLVTLNFNGRQQTLRLVNMK